MSELQIWIAMYLAIGVYASWGLNAGSGQRMALVVFWPINIVTWFISQERRLKQLKCNWCGSPGKVIGLAYGPKLPNQKIAKCKKCHHEWQALVTDLKIQIK